MIQEYFNDGEDSTEPTFWEGIGRTNPGLQLNAAVIAKLKARFAPGVPPIVEHVVSVEEEEGMKEMMEGEEDIESSSDDRSSVYEFLDPERHTETFRVSFRNFDRDRDPGNEFDNEDPSLEGHISFLREAPTDEEMTRTKQYKPITAKRFDQLDDHIDDLKFAIHSLKEDPGMEHSWTHIRVKEVLKHVKPGMTTKQKLEQIRADKAKAEKDSDDRQLYDRYLIQKMAIDPMWEEKAEKKAKTQGQYMVPEWASDDIGRLGRFVRQGLRR